MHIQDFPDTTMLLIFSFLGEADLCRVAQACRSWRLIAYDSSLWKSVNLKRFHKLNEICLIKLIRSRMVPMLYKLNLGGFTLTPRVFQVLVKHCPQLRVLCLESATFVEDFPIKASLFEYHYNMPCSHYTLRVTDLVKMTELRKLFISSELIP